MISKSIAQQNKKDMLIRKNKGNFIVDSYVSKINRIFGFQISKGSFLNLYDTDHIMKKSPTVKTGVEIVRFGKGDFQNSIEEYNSRFSEQVFKFVNKKNFYVFLDQYWYFCGAFIVELDDLLKINIRFNELILDGIIIVSEDYFSKLWLDYTESGSIIEIEMTTYENGISDIFI